MLAMSPPLPQPVRLRLDGADDQCHANHEQSQDEDEAHGSIIRQSQVIDVDPPTPPVTSMQRYARVLGVATIARQRTIVIEDVETNADDKDSYGSADRQPTTAYRVLTTHPIRRCLFAIGVVEDWREAFGTCRAGHGAHGQRKDEGECSH
jgi:hypothetical protein